MNKINLSRVEFCALSADWTGSCQLDEKGTCGAKFASRCYKYRGFPPFVAYNYKEVSLIFMKSKSKNNLVTLIVCAMLVALEVVLSRFFSYATAELKIGFAFIPVVIAAILFGPYQAAIVAGTADLVGALMFPIGAYFPGFTLSAALAGFMFGAIFRKSRKLPAVIIAVVSTQIVRSLLLDTLWLTFLTKNPFLAQLVIRLPQVAIMTVVQIVVIALLNKILTEDFKKRLNRPE